MICLPSIRFGIQPRKRPRRKHKLRIANKPGETSLWNLTSAGHDRDANSTPFSNGISAHVQYLDFLADRLLELWPEALCMPCCLGTIRARAQAYARANLEKRAAECESSWLNPRFRRRKLQATPYLVKAASPNLSLQKQRCAN